MKLTNKDELYEVLREPTRENFRVLLQNHLGEEDYLDFKEKWPDKEKMIKHILAIANYGGGCIVFGVEQKEDGTFETKGLNKFKDYAELNNEVKKYIPSSLKYYLKDFTYENSEYEAMKGKKFQILIIENNPYDLPFVCCKDGNNINDGDIYIRKGTESIKANNFDIEKMIETKMKASKVHRRRKMYLEQHLKQLEILYSELTYTSKEGGILSIVNASMKSITGTLVTYKKDCYPKEDYEAFILRMLDKKKKRIEEELDV